MVQHEGDVLYQSMAVFEKKSEEKKLFDGVLKKMHEKCMRSIGLMGVHE
jgi:hypothetical protein